VFSFRALVIGVIAAKPEAVPRSSDLANTKAQRLQRSRTQFIGIALALASDFDDPLGDDLPDQIGLPIVMKGMARAIKRFAHRLGCIVIERRTLEKRKDISHWGLL
jgi:hypothetical protein